MAFSRSQLIAGVMVMVVGGIVYFSKDAIAEGLDTMTGTSTRLTPEQLSALIERVWFEEPRTRSVPKSVILAVCKIESSLDPAARGGNTEVGLTQVKYPYTWKDVQKRFPLPNANDPNNPKDQLKIGMAYLVLVNTELARLGFPNASWSDVVEAYNQGPAGWVRGRRNPNHVAKFARAQASYEEYDA